MQASCLTLKPHGLSNTVNNDNDENDSDDDDINKNNCPYTCLFHY